MVGRTGKGVGEPLSQLYFLQGGQVLWEKGVKKSVNQFLHTSSDIRQKQCIVNPWNQAKKK